MAVTQHEELVTMQSELTIGEAAEQAARSLPGHRVEILQGRLTVTPPADVAHALALAWLGEEFGARARGVGLRLVQAVGIWLPTGPDDYAIPDLSVVEADIRDAHVMKNCYAPHVFRMVYVVADRKHDQVLVCTDPRGGEYRTRTPHKRGMSFTVPDVVGVEMELSVDRLLNGDED